MEKKIGKKKAENGECTQYHERTTNVIGNKWRLF